MAEGEAKGRAGALVDVLRNRFPPGVPPEMVAAIQRTTDLERLRHWIDLAFAADSLDAFRQAAGI